MACFPWRCSSGLNDCPSAKDIWSIFKYCAILVSKGGLDLLKDYLIVEKSALPDYFLKVIEARRLLESGMCQQVSNACEQVGISRSTYYKYKDRVIEPSRLTTGRKAVLLMLLNHEAGVLSKVLNRLSSFQANILTITQSLPIHDRASVTISMDISGISDTLESMLTALEEVSGVEMLRLVAVE
ncbi:MAG TPA: ACT domain-containing protein [Candidatus Pullichristensenella excrementigallinarum]|uniref:UPF0735 ACT domain-containing protein IAB02_00735 n=1 Tax=Candidatus Pullichristensenella excrementigallinarum TaxID=2840907 RepID=A0A9D1I9C5_9FIRM|nr:ACT domain-containing protein [Candidatus Pullichristensenella excrementigallinarum]